MIAKLFQECTLRRSFPVHGGFPENTAKMRGTMKLKLPRLVLVGIVVIVALMGCVASSWAQSATTGALTGIVTNTNGAPAPGVTVTLFSTATGQTQTTMTNGNGLFGFSLLPPGTYEVNFSAQKHRL